MKIAISLSILALSALLSGCGQQPPINITAHEPTVIDARDLLKKSLSPQDVIDSNGADAAYHIENDPQVIVNFTASDGSTEQIGFENKGGFANYDGDGIFALSSDMPKKVRDYQQILNNGGLAESSVGGGISSQGHIGKRGFFCAVKLFWCWAMAYNQPAWPTRTIYFDIKQLLGFGFDTSGFSSAQAQDIRAAVSRWNDQIRQQRAATGTQLGVLWVEGLSPDPLNPTVSFVKLTGGFPASGIAPIGYTFQRAVKPFIGLNENIWNDSISFRNGTITHEMGHAVGLNHEHQRCDRDQFLNIVMTRREQLKDPMNYNKLCVWGEDMGKFNYSSVMIYGGSKLVAKYNTAAKYEDNLPYIGNPADQASQSKSELDKFDILDSLKALYP